MCKMDIEDVVVSDLNSSFLTKTKPFSDPIPISTPPGRKKLSPNGTPTNISPIITPKTTSPDNHMSKLADPKFIDQYVGQKLMQEKTKTNTYGDMLSTRTSGASAYRHFFNGLDTIPEYQVTDPPSTFQPLVPPPVPVPKVATTSYNISFPTTLQPRDRFDMWRNHNWGHTSSARYSSGTASSCSSVPQSPGSSVTVSCSVASAKREILSIFEYI